MALLIELSYSQEIKKKGNQRKGKASLFEIEGENHIIEGNQSIYLSSTLQCNLIVSPDLHGKDLLGKLLACLARHHQKETSLQLEGLDRM